MKFYLIKFLYDLLASQLNKLFSEGKKPVQVAIALNLREAEATKLFMEYCKLKRLHILNSIFKETNGRLGSFLKLYRLIKERGMTIEKVANSVDIAANKLPHMDILYRQVKEEVENLQRIRQGLMNYKEALKYKISLLDKAAFSCEQESRRAEQQVQELRDKKDRIEKLNGYYNP